MINPPQPLVYGSVCSGIEAATVAWHPLGWQPAPVVGPKLVRDADVGKGEGKGGLFT